MYKTMLQPDLIGLDFQETNQLNLFQSVSKILLLKGYVTEKGVKIGFVMWPIRTAVSGKQNTPGGATELMEVLGKEESLKRIRAGIALLQAN